MLSRSLPPSEVLKGLRELNALLTASEEKAIEVVGVHVRIQVSPGGRSTITTLSYQIEQARGWLLGSVILLQEADVAVITSARFNRMPASLQEMNRFTFENKGPVHYGFLAAAIAVLAFVLGTLVVCLRSRLRRKWLWVIVVLSGVGTVRLNWSSGQSEFQPVSVQLFGTSALAAGWYAPWIVGVSLPLGAIVFLACRKRLLIAADDEPG